MAEERRTLRAGIRSLPGPVWILCAGSFVNRFGSFVAVFLVLYLREKGYSIAEAGFIVSLYGAGNVMAAAVGGLVADRLGRRNAIAISMFSSAATLLALSQADEIVLIGTLTVLAGLTGEMYRPASAALLADLVPAGQRLPAFALNRLAINLGFAAGPATAGLLADRSFTYLFVGDALTSIVFGRSRSPRSRKASAPAAETSGAAREFGRSPATARSCSSSSRRSSVRSSTSRRTPPFRSTSRRTDCPTPTTAC
jgi:MFS family permease